MKPIVINLGSADPGRKRLNQLAVALAAIFALGISACNAHYGYRYTAEAAAYGEKIQRLEQRRKEIADAREARKTEMKEKEVAATQAHVRFVNRLILLDVFPWTRVLGAFETGLPPEVHFESFVPAEGFNPVTLRGAARSMSEVSAYLKEKESQEIFRKIDLLEINVDSEPAAVADRLPVRFEIESTLNFEELLPPKTYGRLWRLAAKPPKES